MTSDKSAFGYAVGDFGINLYFISTMTWLMAFYTDVVGLAPFVVAGIFFVARLIDALTDPLIGLLAERTQSRWGRMKPLTSALAVSSITCTGGTSMRSCLYAVTHLP